MSDHIPLWMQAATWVVGLIIAWVSSPPWQKTVAKGEAKAEAFADALPPTQHALVMAAIRWAEKQYGDLTGAERMARAVVYANHFGVPVTPGQVQGVYDVMKIVGLFDEQVTP